MKKAIITGGSGFIGKATAQLLLREGVQVTVIGRRSSAVIQSRNMEYRQGDVRDRHFLKKVFHGHDAVFHVAAKAGIWGDRSEYYGINVEGTENVIAACLENAIPILVHTSTPSVVSSGTHIEGGDETLPFTTRFLCHYVHTKVLAEKKVLRANGERLKTVALRPHLVWGPGDTNLIPRLLDRGKKQLLKQVGDGRNRVDISYIDNVAAAHVLAAKNLEGDAASAGKAYFISQGEPVNLWGWINELFRMLDVPEVSKQVSFRKAYVAGAALEMIYNLLKRRSEPLMTRFLAEQLGKSHWFSIEAARRDFGYDPVVTTRQGLERLVASIKSDL